MDDWQQFAEATPELATFGRRQLERRIAYLATLRADGSPRVHPVSPFFADDHLFVYMEPTSPKRHDLRRDQRFALHCTVEDNSGGDGEFLINGVAREVTDHEMRRRAFEGAAASGYSPQERYIVFELGITSATATIYEAGEAKRAKWRAGNASDSDSATHSQDSSFDS